MLAGRASGAAGAVADGAGSDGPILSADGHVVAFFSRAKTFSPEHPGGAVSEVYVRDLAARVTTLVSRADGAGGAVADEDSYPIGLSGDGDRVLFLSSAPALGADPPERRSFARDVGAARTRLRLPRGRRSRGAGGGQRRRRRARRGRHVRGLHGAGGRRRARRPRRRVLGGARPRGRRAVPGGRARDDDHVRPGRATPAFAFTSNVTEGVRFECRVDGGPWAACASPSTVAAPAPGAHTFAVRAVLRAVLPDPTPATRAFTVTTGPGGADTTAPRISRLKVAPKRWRLARKRTPRVAAARRGAGWLPALRARA